MRPAVPWWRDRRVTVSDIFLYGMCRYTPFLIALHYAQKVRVDRLACHACAVGGLPPPLSQEKPTTLEGRRLSSRRQGGWESAPSRVDSAMQRPKFLGSLVRRSYFLSARR